MFWWKVNSSLKIKILDAVAIWNCKITLDLFPFRNFFSFLQNNWKQSLSCWQTAQLNKRLAVFIHSKSLMLRGQYLHSLLPHHMVLLTGCRAKGELWLISRRLSRNSWSSWSESPCCEASTPLLLSRVWPGGCDSRWSREGSVHGFPFCRKGFSARFPFPFVYFLKHPF